MTTSITDAEAIARPVNRIWFDTEFIEDGATIDLISIGMVRSDGATYYAETDQWVPGKASQWVKDNVIVHLRGGDTVKPRDVIAREIVEFAGGDPEFWAYYADYDWVALCQLFGTMMQLPDGWPKFCRDIKQLCADLGDPRLPEQAGTEHYALADALWNKAAWDFLASRRESLEPVAWQYRVMFDKGSARENEWCPWRDAGKKYFDTVNAEIKAGATRVQIRALYTAPPQSATDGALREALAYAERLAVGLWSKHSKASAPNWKPLTGDLMGLLTQIDNMTAALAASEATKSDGIVEGHDPEGTTTVAASGMRESRPRDMEAAGSQREAEAGWPGGSPRVMEQASNRESQDSDRIGGPAAARGGAGIKPGPSDTRSADVTVDARAKIDWWLREIRDCNERMWNRSRETYFGHIAKGVDAIRALLDTYKIGAK